MKVSLSLKKVFKLLKDSLLEFIDDNGLKFSAALAYYTIFSIGPIVLIIISVTGFFFGRDAMEGRIYYQINQVIGKEAAMQVQETIKNIHLSGKNLLATIIGIVMLIIGASGIFAEIQDSINIIWGFKSKPKKYGIVKLLINRLLSFSMIISMGFILMVSLALNAGIDLISHTISNYFPHVAVILLFILNNVITFVSVAFLFAIIFKVLPDARIKWKEVWVGAVVTSLLFMCGKFLIGFYLGQSQIASSFGAASSIIVMMVWVYYNAIILYFGAEFTQKHTQFKGVKIYPNEYSVEVENKTIELNKTKTKPKRVANK